MTSTTDAWISDAWIGAALSLLLDLTGHSKSPNNLVEGSQRGDRYNKVSGKKKKKHLIYNTSQPDKSLSSLASSRPLFDVIGMSCRRQNRRKRLALRTISDHRSR
jgi:hypothetical protein